MIRKIILPLLPLLLSANEPSAFDAGNLDLENPYGLTQSEKAILENKKTIKKLDNSNKELTIKVNTLSREFDVTNEKIEGLLSVVDGSNKGLHERLVEQNKQIESLKVQNQKLKEDID